MSIKHFFAKKPEVVVEKDGSKSLMVNGWQNLFYSKEIEVMIDEVYEHNDKFKKQFFETEVRRIVREELMKIKHAAPAPVSVPVPAPKPGATEKKAPKKPTPPDGRVVKESYTPKKKK